MVYMQCDSPIVEIEIHLDKINHFIIVKEYASVLPDKRFEAP